MSDAESGDQEEVRWKQFLKSPGHIPCVKQSFLTGISSGMGIGVAYFLFTSNVKRATNVGFGGYLLVTAGTWFYCRYTTAQKRKNTQLYKKALQRQIVSEGTLTEAQLGLDNTSR